MTKRIYRKRSKIELKERLSISALVMTVVMLLFVVVIVTTTSFQTRSLKKLAYSHLYEQMVVNIDDSAIRPFPVDSAKGKNSEISDKYHLSEDDSDGIVVIKSGSVTRWSYGSETKDNNILQAIIEQSALEDSNEFLFSHFYVGIYTGSYYNSTIMKQFDGTHYRLSEKAIVYAAVNFRTELNNTVNMIKILTQVLAITFVIMIPLSYFASYLILKPSINAMKKEKEFVANASHKLKTPLAIILANSSLIQEIDNTNAKYCMNIKDQCQNMNETIIDMIDLSKLDSDTKPEITKVNLSTLLTDLVLSFEAVAYENDIEYIYEIEDNLILDRADRKALTRMFNLLIENSMKYTEGEKKQLKIVLKKKKKDYFFSIYNTGCQVEDEDREKVFNRFYQGKSGSDIERKGSGLGLAIVKKICERYSYDLSIKSKHMEYCEFDIVLR